MEAFDSVSKATSEIPPKLYSHLKTVSYVSYILHTIVAVATVIPGFQGSALILLISFVLDLWKKPLAYGTWLESHFAWRIRSVILAMLLYSVTAPLWLLFFIPGWIVWFLVSIWFLYRVVVGFIALKEFRTISE